MAIKQHSLDNDQQNQKHNIHVILMFIDRVEDSQSDDRSYDDIFKVFEHLICLLANCEVASTPDQIVPFKEQIGKVEGCIKKLMSSVPKDKFPSFVHSFFTSILKFSKPSGAAGVVLNSLDIQKNELRIPRPNDSDESVRRGVSILCQWFSCSFFIRHIDFWINGIIDRLQEQQRFDLITKITLENIDVIFKSFLLPYCRPKAASVLQKMLLSSQHNATIYQQTFNFFSKINQKDQDIRKTIDNLLSVMAPFSSSVSKDDFKPVEVMRNYSLSAKGPIRHTRDTLVGLVNLGNTCYMNSVLQALMITKQFSREVLLSEIRAPLFQTIQKLLALLLHSIRPALTPRSILHTVQPPGFKAGHQQDSSEFLVHLLETLHELEKSHSLSLHNGAIGNSNNFIEKGLTNKPSCSKSNETVLNLQRVVSEDDDMDVSGDVHDDREGARALSPSVEHAQAKQFVPKTIIQKTFGGNVSITYKCLNCGTESKQFDSFRDFQLSFPETETTANTFTIRDLIEYNCSAEKLIKDNQYSCDQCKMLCDGERLTSIVNAPANLILTLKYFKYDQKYFTRTKLMHKVKYDETISIKVTSSSDQNESVLIHYRLYAAVVHSGVSLDSGHYFTYGAFKPEQWYRFEDTYVTSSSLAELYDLQPPNTPYILFYRMVDYTESSLAAAVAAATPTTNTTTDVSVKDGNQNSSSSPSTCDMMNIPRNACMIGTKLELPALEELPPHLREYVNGDNITYENEWRSLQQQQTIYRPNTTTGNSFRDSDNDDPPSSCGDSMMPPFNRFIY